MYIKRRQSKRTSTRRKHRIIARNQNKSSNRSITPNDNYFIIDNMIKFQKNEIDETSCFSKKDKVIGLIGTIIYIFGIEKVFIIIPITNVSLRFLVVTLFFIIMMIGVDRYATLKIYQKHKLNIRSFTIPNENLNRIKINLLKTFLDDNNLLDTSSISFLLKYMNDGVPKNIRVFFPFKSTFFNVFMANFSILLSVLFTFKFVRDQDAAIQMLGDYFGYFTIIFISIALAVFLIGNYVNQIYTSKNSRIIELKKLLIQIYLEI